MNCPKCGTQNEDKAEFCKACGFDLKAVIVDLQPQPPVPATNLQANVNPATPPGSVASLSPSGMSVPRPVQYAGFWIRFVANLIDVIILALLGGVVGGIIGFIIGLTFRAFGGTGWVGGFAGQIVGWLYYALMESSTGRATVGKMALGLVVTDLNGNRISFGRATGRYFSKILSSLILGIGYLMIAFTEKKQGLHDMIAGTLVVKK